MAKRKKVRPSTAGILQKRLPQLRGPTAIEGRYLAWRLGNGDRGGPFTIDNLSEDNRRTVWERMSAFEKMTVSEVIATGSHPIPLSQLSEEAKTRLEHLKIDDLDDIWSFRVTNTSRFWCIKHENIYALLWWDPYHKVCPSSKKHT